MVCFKFNTLRFKRQMRRLCVLLVAFIMCSSMSLMIFSDTWETFDDAFYQDTTKDLQLVPLDYDLIDYVWTEDRPPKPNEPIYIHTLEYAG